MYNAAMKKWKLKEEKVEKKSITGKRVDEVDLEVLKILEKILEL